MFRKMAARPFVLVNLQKSTDTTCLPAKFTDSVLDVLCGGKNVGSVYAEVDKDRLIVSNHPRHTNHKDVRIKRPSFCPIHNMSPEQAQALPEDVRTRGINSGAATILESSDGKILLTRRARHLRTFPGVWVPPGGHIEYGETFREAALREMQEETGISLDANDVSNVQELAMWESVFPTKLSIAPPKRHHVVCYIHLKLREPNTAEMLNKLIKMDPEEVGASAWMDRQMVQAIVAASEEGEETGTTNQINQQPPDLPSKFKATVITREGAVSDEWLDTAVLTRVCDGGQTDVERVSTGTKFALSEWLAAQTYTSSKF